MPNTELIEKTLQRIEAMPEEWRMADWYAYRPDGEGNVCGTTACFAGHVALAAGYKLVIPEGAAGKPVYEAEPPYFVNPDGSDTGKHVEDIAEELLGLPDWAARKIFFATYITTPAQLREHVTETLEYVELRGGDL